MLNSIFPITSNWSWLTFFLYLIVSFFTVKLCKQGLLFQETSLSEKKSVNINSAVCFIMAWLLLVMLATLRDETVGTDTKNYIPYFLTKTSVDYRWEDFFSFRQREPGFQYYIYFIRTFTDNYTYLFFVTYSFIAFAYIYFIKNTCHHKNNTVFLYIFIFYYTSNMSGMRSAIGAAFILLSFLSLEKKSYFKSAFLTAIGVLFHYTMIFNFYVILSHWLLNNTKIREKRSLWITLIVFTIAFSNFGIYYLKGLFAGTKYDYYSVDGADTSLLGSMFFVILGVLCIYFYKEIISRDSITNSNLIICMCLLASYPLLFVTGAYRIPNYYIMPRLYIWSVILEELNKKMTRKSIPLYYISIRILAILFLLLRFTKSSVDGGFIYKLK